MDSFSVQLNAVLDEYSKEVARATTNAMDAVAKESVKTLKATSPKRPGHGEYARGWTIKRTRNGSGIPTVIVHNKVYQLTHLLENGHDIVVPRRSGINIDYVSSGRRTKAIKHIKPVEQWANNELPRRIEEDLE